MSFVVYTAVYGGYDPLRPHPVSADVDEWICYTDDPALAGEGWTTVVEAPRYPHPRMSAKWRKCNPPPADRSLFIDGSIGLHSADFVGVLNGLLDGADLALFRHPDRSNVAEEAVASQVIAGQKYGAFDLDAQVARYNARRPVADLGLWCSGVFARNHSPAVLGMGGSWLAHNDLLSIQDQLSLPVLIADYGLTVAAIAPGSITSNPWFAWCGHNRGD